MISVSPVVLSQSFPYETGIDDEDLIVVVYWDENKGEMMSFTAEDWLLNQKTSPETTTKTQVPSFQVPEPSIIILMLLALGIMGVFVKKL